jgi:AcrR family transcriptional regulator
MDDKKNRQSWLEAGLDTLAGEGPDALRIMPIASKLGVTKGSFYWHFKNLDDYHDALLQAWDSNHTQQSIGQVDGCEDDVAVRLRALFSSASPRMLSLGRAIRAWSMTSSRVREALARVDQRRIDYAAGLLVKAGWPDSEAPFVARWHYCALVGHAAIGATAISQQELDTLMQLLIRR